MQHVSISELQHLHHQCDACAFAPFCLPKASCVKHGTRLTRKQHIVYAGSSLQTLYIVNAGFLVAYHLGSDGTEKILQFYFPGEILGFEALSDGKYPYSVRAGSNALVCHAPYEGLLKKIAEESPLQQKILKLATTRLRDNNLSITTSAEEKLLFFFKELAQRLHCEGATPEFTLPITRQDVGNYLGLAGETISRLLARLQLSKKISIHHKRIKIL